MTGIIHMSKEDIILFEQLWADYVNTDDSQKIYRISGKVISIGYRKGCMKGGISIDILAGQGAYTHFFFNRKLAVPIYGRHIVVSEIKLSDVIYKVYNKNRHLFINASYEQIEDTAYVYYKPDKQFIRRYALKEYPVTGKPLRAPLHILLVVPQKGKQGETDFLRSLHPSAWESITKFRMNMVDAKSIVNAINKLKIAYGNNKDKDINCVCVIRGGGNGIEIFSDKSVVRAFHEMKKSLGSDVFLIAGIGHSDDCIGCNDIFDVSAFTPSHAAIFINEQLGL